MHVANSAADNFFDFASRLTLEQTSGCKCLADYMMIWLIRGRGVEECAKDFTIYLQAFLVIANRYMRGEGTLGYVESRYNPEPTLPNIETYHEREVTNIFNVEDETEFVTHAAFQPDFFLFLVNSDDRSGFWHIAPTV